MSDPKLPHSSLPRGVLARGALIGAILAVCAGSFVWAAGWLSPSRISPAKVADALEAHNGDHPGVRRAHEKGMCVVGHFDANGHGAALSSAGLFAPGRTPLFGRFSLGVGSPNSPDGVPGFHALGLSFQQADGQVWRMALDDTPIFPVSTPQAFVDFQVATTPVKATGQPDPAKVKAYLAQHPETRAFMAWMKQAPFAASFAASPYNSINAFRFTNAQGQTRAVRWTFKPEAPFVAEDKDKLAQLNKTQPNFLFDEAIGRLAQAPMRWHLLVTVAQPGDPTDDANKLWPADREQMDVGTLVLERAMLEDDGPCRDVTFDPLILPSGVAASDDPLLAARSAAYSASFVRRAGEKTPESALAKDPAAAQLKGVR